MMVKQFPSFVKVIPPQRLRFKRAEEYNAKPTR